MEGSRRESVEQIPVPTIRLVPRQHQVQPMAMDTYSNFPTKQLATEAPPKKPSKWLWPLALLVLALHLIGLGILIGYGIWGLRSSSSEDSEAAAESPDRDTSIVGFHQDTIPPQSLAVDVSASANTERPSVATTITIPPQSLAVVPTAGPATMAPTSANPTLGFAGCMGIPHSEVARDINNPLDAGTFGGSAHCYDFAYMCQAAEWVPFFTDSGTTSKWFIATAFCEASHCAPGAGPGNVEHNVKLKVPPGVDYKLNVYKVDSFAPYDMYYPNYRDAAEEEGMAMQEVIVSTIDDSAQYYIHVEYRSGSSCAPWTLQIDGHQCD
ncbi:expressed unknown protein [Seminavis robusta]|uniref:Uncharacterized protein n=1 Tax=Seminavis robusta TaxID=568900 RepID=A0A9N8EBM6_9STRA|nr:expressed unknown protein [Seminavis robusta]|eukprot:Sro855_g211480.1 n/a (324) ;mRNA; r:39810-40781